MIKKYVKNNILPKILYTHIFNYDKVYFKI